MRGGRWDLLYMLHEAPHCSEHGDAGMGEPEILLCGVVGTWSNKSERLEGSMAGDPPGAGVLKVKLF